MDDDSQLVHVCAIIKSGGIVAYPTEAVFGLGCDPFNQVAVAQLLLMKQRSIEKGLILVASNIKQILPLIKPQMTDDLANALKTWPGNNTWVFPKSNIVPHWLSGGHDSIAVRLSDHPIVVQLCNELDHCLVSTSANISKHGVLDSIKAIRSVFGDKIQAYIDAPVGRDKSPSTIRDAHTRKLIR